MTSPEGLRPGDPRQIVDTRLVREEPFPEDPNARFEAIFAAIGNSEAKCVTLLTMQPYPLTQNELHTEFLRATNRVWETSTRLQTIYCNKSLIPIGLVAQADIISYGSLDYVTGYRLTESGEYFGQPIAAFLLQQSTNLPHSLFEIFGPTSKGSGDTRSAINRARLLEYLHQKALEDPNVAYSDLQISKATGINASTVSQALKHLQKLGLVDYKSFQNEQKGSLVYTAVQDSRNKQVEPVGTDKALTKTVAEFILSHDRVDFNTVVDNLKIKYPDSNETALRKRIGTVLQGLAKQGIVSRSFVTGRFLSQATIAPLGAQVTWNILIPIRIALSSDESENLTSWTNIPWNEYAKEGVIRFRESSGHANQRSLDERTNHAHQLILDQPGIRQKDIKAHLKREPADVLRILLAEGKVIKERTGRTVRYYPRPLT